METISAKITTSDWLTNLFSAKPRDLSSGPNPTITNFLCAFNQASFSSSSLPLGMAIGAFPKSLNWCNLGIFGLISFGYKGSLKGTFICTGPLPAEKMVSYNAPSTILSVSA